MACITFDEAIAQAIRQEMRRDPRVLFLGQDITLFMDAQTRNEIGPQRVLDTPISEAGFIGAGIGAALTGMRPVIELGCSTFMYSAMDQIVNQAAKSRYMFGGQASVPMVIRAPVLYSIAAAAHHADRPWGMFAQAPGLKIIIPTTPYDAKGLLISAIRDANPVICFEDVNLSSHTGEVPEGEYTVPIGVAAVRRAGDDVTIVALAAAVHRSMEAADRLADDGISAEVIDVRSVVPLDRRTILESVKKTGRLVVVDPAPRTCSVAAEISASVVESAFQYLQAPSVRLTAPDVPVPFSPCLENAMYPTVERIVDAVRVQSGFRPLNHRHDRKNARVIANGGNAQ